MSEKSTVTILRYNPELDKSPFYKKYAFKYLQGMTVLDVLLQLVEEQDEGLGFNYCCRNSHCGLCGAKVNGREVLMCRQAAAEDLLIEPLDHLTVVRDLIVDFDQYEDRITKLRPFLDCLKKPSLEPHSIEMKHFNAFKEASRCVLCLCCVSACPVYPRYYHIFLGPAAYTRKARHFFDPRDQLDRCLIFKEQGLDLCISCGSCSRVCPHKARPRELIDMIKEKCLDGKERSDSDECAR